MSPFTIMAAHEASVFGRSVCLIILSFVVIKCSGLNCRSPESRKEQNFKNVFMSCLERQDGRNSSNRSRGADPNWRGNSKDERKVYRDEGYSSSDDRYAYQEDVFENIYENGYENDRNDGMSAMGEMGGRDRNSGTGGMDRNGGMGGRYNNNRNKSRSRDKNERNGGREALMRNRSRNGNNDRVNGREDFQQSTEFDDASTRYKYRSRQKYKRSRNSDQNSGHRSQYNPNTSKQNSWSDEKHRSERNSSEDGGSDGEPKVKACTLYCLLHNLEMTAPDGMPDKYLTTHVLTKNVQNEDLRDFLQESVEECFLILENENTEDKCEFSKNLFLCLSEKARANCDDWREEETGIKIL